jgi:hypothetical protein
MDLTSPAYFIPGKQSVDVAREMPELQRILPAGPWATALWAHPSQGWGVLAWWADCAQPEPAPEQWRQCQDGLWYARAPRLATQEQLAKPNMPPAIDVQLASGRTISVPMALVAPRKLRFGAQTVGDYATEFGQLAHQLHSAILAGTDMPQTHPLILGTMLRALELAYRVTDEILDDLEWLTDADVDPIICAVMGLDPKADAHAKTSSPCASPA